MALAADGDESHVVQAGCLDVTRGDQTSAAGQLKGLDIMAVSRR